MTGTGTVSDPYIITSWADMEAVSDATACYMLGCDLDANDRNNGVWSALTLRALHIDGNGKSISNIYSTSSVVSGLILPSGITIDDIAIVDVQLSAPLIAYTPNGDYDVQIQNCEIDCACKSALVTPTSTGYNHGIIIDSSDITFGCVMESFAPGWSSWDYIPCGANTQVVRSRVRLDFETPVADTYAHVLTPTAQLHIWDTVKLTGTYKRAAAGGIEINATNSCVTLDCTNVSGVTLTGAAGAVSVMDSTLAGCAITATNAAELTTAQMQSYDALTAAGFPVVMYT